MSRLSACLKPCWGHGFRRAWVFLLIVLMAVVTIALSYFQLSVLNRRRLKHLASQFLYNGNDDSANCGAEVFFNENDSELYEILVRKLAELPDQQPFTDKNFQDCESLPTALGLCYDKHCKASFSRCTAKRLQQVLATRNHSLGSYLTAMEQSLHDVRDYKYIFVSAASSNHYEELQALVHTFQCHVFPNLTNVAFLIFDLGLTAQERELTQKHCGCTLLDFPFAALPDMFSKLKCYTWKPVIINAVLPKSEFTIWMDTSVRWTARTPIEFIFKRVKDNGLQFGMSWDGAISLRTLDSMLQFYGDSACQYQSYPEIWATYGFFYNEKFVREAVLHPWISCAFRFGCMCVPDYKRVRWCVHTLPRKLGACHRFDQSSLGIILSKLYLEKTGILLRVPSGVGIAWEHKMSWFNNITTRPVCYSP